MTRSLPRHPPASPEALPTAAGIRAALDQARPQSVPQWRPLRRAWTQALADAPPVTLFEIADALLDIRPWGRLTAYELIADHPATMAALTTPRIRRLARGLDDWVGVDTFGCQVAGPAWRDGRLPTAAVNRWAAANDRWLRRLALVCTVPLNLRARGGQGDTARTLALCRQLVGDRDDMVVKALSWALRALVVWDARAVAAFLAEHDQGLAPRVRREVATKLRIGTKR